MSGSYMWIVLAFAGVVLLVWVLTVGRFFALYIQAMFSGAPVALLEIVRMTLRKVNPRVIVLSRIRAVKAGLDIRVEQMQQHYLAGGNVPDVVTLMVAAKKAGVAITWEQATTLDLGKADLRGLVEQIARREITHWADLLPPEGDESIN